jgi:hypothetical protein
MQFFNATRTVSSFGASTLTQTQTATATASAGSATGESTTSAKSAREAFLDYAKLTPAQKMRAAILSKLNITEEELKAMPPKKRQRIEDQIKEMIKQQVMGGDKDKIQRGTLLDLTA